MASMEDEYWRAVIFFYTMKGFDAKQIENELNEVHKGNMQVPSYSTIAHWASEWKKGRRSIQDEQEPGGPADATTLENITRIQKMVENNHRITIEQINQVMNLSYGTVQNILADELEFIKLSASWVPKTLSNLEKEKRCEISNKHLDRIGSDREKFFDRIITQDEIWVHHLNVETQSQSPSKSRVTRRRNKVMASVFWDCKGVIMIEGLEKGKKVTEQYYADQLVRLKECIKKKRRGMITKGVRFLQDNTPVHMATNVLHSITTCGFELLEQPPHSPDLAPSHYYLFPSLKTGLQGQEFSSNTDVIEAVEDFFDGKEEQFFKTGIHELEERWTKCVFVQGDYIER